MASSVSSFSWGWSARAERTSSSATSARIGVAEIAAGSVTARVTDWNWANRTRTETVRPARCLARSREATRSAR